MCCMRSAGANKCAMPAFFVCSAECISPVHSGWSLFGRLRHPLTCVPNGIRFVCSCPVFLCFIFYGARAGDASVRPKSGVLLSIFVLCTSSTTRLPHFRQGLLLLCSNSGLGGGCHVPWEEECLGYDVSVRIVVVAYGDLLSRHLVRLRLHYL